MDHDIFSILWLLLKSSCIDFIVLTILLGGTYFYIRLQKTSPTRTSHVRFQNIIVCLTGGYAFSLVLITFYIIHRLGWSIEPNILVTYAFSQNPIDLLLLSVFQILGLLIGVILVLLVTGVNSRSIGLCKPTRGLWIASLVVVIGLSVVLLASFLNNTVLSPDSDIVDLRSKLHDGLGQTPKYFHLLYIIALAPIVEELFFRGVLYELFENYTGFKVAIFLQVTLYAVMHNDVGMFLFYVVFGIVLGYSRYLSKSLIPAIIIHIIFMGVGTIDLWS